MAPRIFIIGLLAIFIAGCGAYSGLSQPVQSAFMRGDYLQALAALDKAKVDKKDKLLYFLDKGALLHYAGEYEKSNEAFSEAEDLADQLETKSATKEVGATLTNETLLPYAGEKYERLLINVFKMLNYAALDEWDEAFEVVTYFSGETAASLGQVISASGFSSSFRVQQLHLLQDFLLL